MVMTALAFSRRGAASAARNIPATDYIDARFDNANDVRTTDVGVVLSTPRSGSTLLCELLRLNGGCVAHEYFQPYQYLPILADRWNCTRRGRLDDAAFVRALCRNRTTVNGWLGVNVHGSHLRNFSRMERHFGGVRFHFVHLVREDQLAQATSFVMARQTKQWSSEFHAVTEPTYSFNRILRQLRVIENQNTLIRSFLAVRGSSHVTIRYEDIVAKPAEVLSHFGCVGKDRPPVLDVELRRQSDDRAKDWKRRFNEEVLARQRLAHSEGRRRPLPPLTRLRLA